MDLILNQIDRALDRGFHYLAVVSTLTLPDICSALESQDGRTTQKTYEDWYDTWLAAKYPRITGFDMYRLRCGLIHQGRLGPPGMTYDRIVFRVDGAGFMHNNLSVNNAGVAESALQLDAAIFCRDVMASVREWYAAKQHDPYVVANLPNVLQFRPKGIAPHFVGMPVIA